MGIIHHLLTLKGNRYFYWPEKKQCCYCCGSGFCSVLKQDWLTNDGVYKGDEGDFRTFQAQSDGVFVWEEKSTGLYQKVYSFMGSDPKAENLLYSSVMIYDTSKYATTWPEEDKIFDLPTDSNNCEDHCPAQRTCGG